jgi:hypothetical protein
VVRYVDVLTDERGVFCAPYTGRELGVVAVDGVVVATKRVGDAMCFYTFKPRTSLDSWSQEGDGTLCHVHDLEPAPFSRIRILYEEPSPALQDLSSYLIPLIVLAVLVALVLVVARSLRS